MNGLEHVNRGLLISAFLKGRQAHQTPDYNYLIPPSYQIIVVM